MHTYGLLQYVFVWRSADTSFIGLCSFCLSVEVLFLLFYFGDLVISKMILLFCVGSKSTKKYVQWFFHTSFVMHIDYISDFVP
jgi:hypothetical protein